MNSGWNRRKQERKQCTLLDNFSPHVLGRMPYRCFLCFSDVIVNSETGSSLDIAIKMISDHLLVASGMISNDVAKGEENELSQV